MAINEAALEALARQKVAARLSSRAKTTTGTTVPTATVKATQGVNPPTPPRQEPVSPPSIRKGVTAEVAFDPQITALAQAKYPSSWKPFAVESPEADKYIKFVYGDKTLNQLKDDAFIKNAPNYVKLSKTPLPINPVTKQIDPLKYTLSQTVFASIENNVPVQQVKEYIAAQATSNPGSLGGLKLDEANKLVDDLYSEVDAANKAFAVNKQNYLTKNDKYFNASLPHPKFKYGASTNYEMGTIDIRTLPAVSDWLKQYDVYAKETFPGSSAASGIAVEKAINKAKREGGSPFIDEAIRRQDLYKAAIVKP